MWRMTWGSEILSSEAHRILRLRLWRMGRIYEAYVRRCRPFFAPSNTFGTTIPAYVTRQYWYQHDPANFAFHEKRDLRRRLERNTRPGELPWNIPYDQGCCEIATYTPTGRPSWMLGGEVFVRFGLENYRERERERSLTEREPLDLSHRQVVKENSKPGRTRSRMPIKKNGNVLKNSPQRDS